VDIRLIGRRWYRLDSDGRPKEDDEIESWGMVDHEDPRFRKCALDRGITFDEDQAQDAGMFTCSEQEILNGLPGDLEHARSVLRATWQAFVS
jgi:hypothetical protein